MNPQQPPSSKGPGGGIKQIALALELPFLLVAPVVAGGALGYFLDRWWHISPVLMLVGGGLGFAGGLWDILRQLSTNHPKGS